VNRATAHWVVFTREPSWGLNDSLVALEALFGVLSLPLRMALRMDVPRAFNLEVLSRKLSRNLDDSLRAEKATSGSAEQLWCGEKTRQQRMKRSAWRQEETHLFALPLLAAARVELSDPQNRGDSLTTRLGDLNAPVAVNALLSELRVPAGEAIPIPGAIGFSDIINVRLQNITRKHQEIRKKNDKEEGVSQLHNHGT